MAGTPVLSGSGPLVGASTLTMSQQNAAPLAPVAMFIDASATFVHVPFLGGIVVPLSAPLVVPLQTDAFGSASLQIASFPTGVPAGLKLYFQALVADASAPTGLFAFSNAVVGITQ